ncbi:DUF6213 family protein [Streptomyces sp. NPDC021100]|uniref:DUF6213 family protein n=1 Tax=Streptomyces sp. NPDC021100 TaxID=3365114 RepID=UPI003791D37F
MDEGDEQHLPLIRHGGQLYVPTTAVTALLRSIGDQWQEWTRTGRAQLDTATVEAVRHALRDLADRLDVGCIAKSTDHQVKGRS